MNRTVYVDYRTLDGTANAGSDYVNIEDTLIFRPGETNAFIQVSNTHTRAYTHTNIYTQKPYSRK